jgi:transposase
MAKTKLTPEVQDRIVAALRAGNYQETAAAYAGISAKTFYEWLNRGESEEPKEEAFRNFREAVEKAKADAEVRDIALIDKAAHDGSWQAAAWKLERKFPNRWGRVTRTEISGPEGKPVEVRTSVEAILEALGVDDADTQD